MGTRRVLDLGRPIDSNGTCPRCGLTDRPLWAPVDGMDPACASCCTRLYPDTELTFHGVRAVAVTQTTLPGMAA